MVTVTLSRLDSLRVVPLSPRKLRIAAVLFALAAATALLTGCSANSGTDSANSLKGLRGIALATRPSINFASDPAQPQRHARQSRLASIHLPANLPHHQLGLTN